MKNILTDKLVPGMVTGEDILNLNGQLILPKGLSLNKESIDKLISHSVYSINIVNDDSYDTEEDSYSSIIKKSAEFQAFKESFEKEILALENSLNDVITKNELPDLKKLAHRTISLLNTPQSTSSILNMLHSLRHYDDSTFAHSINVSLIANILAKWLHFSEEETLLLTQCGLFHDIGKLLIPSEIIKKPSPLTSEEFEIVKTHPVRGYQIVSNLPLDEHVKNSILMHHEKCDGTGYPNALKSEEIDKFAKIIAICDIYDAMTSARVYRGPLCPFKVITIFEQEGLQKYDTQFIMTFLENIVNTYLGHDIILNNGMRGSIVFINRHKLSRPMIKVKDQFIDLNVRNDLSIEAII
ncbi:MAG: HD-GYP domain-containing protein [Lachnospiraceae bacterium]